MFTSLLMLKSVEDEEEDILDTYGSRFYFNYK